MQLLLIGYIPKAINQKQIDFIMAFFSNKIDLLKSFHQEEDCGEYLECFKFFKCLFIYNG